MGKRLDLIDAIEFDSEAGLFCAHSSNSEALQAFIIAFKECCEDNTVIRDLVAKVIPN